MLLRQHMSRQYNQLDRLNKELEIKQTRASNLEIRNKWMHNKKIKNYQSEYDRIRSHMGNSMTPHQTMDTLMQRKKTLESLGAKAFDGIRN
jgi:uncharacterized protein (DUF111 family)